MFVKSSLSLLALISALSAVAFARPRPEEVVIVTVYVTANGQPAVATPAPKPIVIAPPLPVPVVMPQPLTSKRGLAYNSSSPALHIFLPHRKITWCHSWSALDFSAPLSLEFVPTLADVTANSLPFWKSDVSRARSRGSRYLMSLNEPDQPGSKAFMDVGSAVSIYKQHMNNYAQYGFKLGCPSVTNGVINGMGLVYLTNFLDACRECTIDFVPVHWYGCTNNCAVAYDVQMFKGQMTQAMIAARGKPIWIPEFQRLGSLEDQKAFLEQVLPWLDHPAQAQIERYAYFMVWDEYLTSGGQLNEVGLTYVS